MLDLSNGDNNCKWLTLPTSGTSPGKRYGHTMSYVKPHLIVFGGNVGSRITNDIYLINIDEGILEWKKLELIEDIPCPRMYHANSVCKTGGASGMMIVYGGRSDSNNALNDSWGLRKHRNGTWDWLKAPYSNSYAPLKRYQHSMAFYCNFMIVLGGRTDDDLKSIPIEIYDTESSEWTEMAFFNKFRHSSWIVENNIYTHGGFDYLSPMISKNDLVMIDIIRLMNTNSNLVKKLEKLNDSLSKSNSGLVGNSGFNNMSTNNSSGNNSKNTTPTISPTNSNVMNNPNFVNNNNLNKYTAGNTSLSNSEMQLNLFNKINLNGICYLLNLNFFYIIFFYFKFNFKDTNQKNLKEKQNQSPNRIRFITPVMAKEGEISMITGGGKNDDKLIIKRVSFLSKDKSKPNENHEEPLCDLFLNSLLNPLEWIKKSEQEVSKFKFKPELIYQLTKDCINIVKNQPMVLRVSTPVKVFGDVHGQYIDLMTFFYKWGEPKEGQNGDIIAIDYLFLGDYVDRGNMSLETMCLLMSLKIKYPERIHLLRGNHEDKLINCGFGFLEECQFRLGENPSDDDSVFNVINEFFDYLPLAAVIEDQILCLHGGIGANVKKISDIESIQRPLEVVHEAMNKQEQVVMDILWSDPTDNDDELGIQPNIQRDSNNYGNIVKYGPDIVKSFLQNNGLSYIIRAHECVLDGFERFAGGSLITLFSATDYCRRHNNAGAMIIIKNNFEMVPHLIYPPDGGNKHWIEDEDYYKKRPPTPPRVRYNKNY